MAHDEHYAGGKHARAAVPQQHAGHGNGGHDHSAMIVDCAPTEVIAKNVKTIGAGERNLPPQDGESHAVTGQSLVADPAPTFSRLQNEEVTDYQEHVPRGWGWRLWIWGSIGV